MKLRPFLIVAFGLPWMACGPSKDFSEPPRLVGAPANSQNQKAAPESEDATKASGDLAATPLTDDQKEEIARQDAEIEVSDDSWDAFRATADEEFEQKSGDDFATGEMTNAERAVVVVNDSTTGSPNPAQFRMIDAGMKLLFDRGLRGAYGKVVYLGQGNATWTAFLQAVKDVAMDEKINAVDVIINLHGGEGEILFNDGAVTRDQIATGLTGAVPDAVAYKLRAVYNQACFGATQMEGFTRGGFLTAGGTVGVHSSGLVDWPAFVKNWGAGASFQGSLGPQRMVGKLAKVLVGWFLPAGDQVNNTWQFVGDASVGIQTRMTKG